jgi:hypothetical protein
MSKSADFSEKVAARVGPSASERVHPNAIMQPFGYANSYRRSSVGRWFPICEFAAHPKASRSVRSAFSRALRNPDERFRTVGQPNALLFSQRERLRITR